jgi:predicted SnoaL-like aldol condensation-catalyzing enzyme
VHSWKGIVEARFFCNFWSTYIISIPGQQEERTAGGRSKETRNERIYGPKKQGICPRSVRDTVQQEDLVAAEKFWSPNYIQHSAHIPPGRNGLFGLVKNAPSEMKYENSLIMAEGDMLMQHGRFSGIGLPANWIVVDIVRIENGLLAEHWDVIQDEVTREKSASGRPMFGNAFPS